MVAVRDAASRHMARSLRTMDLAAIDTTSKSVEVDFTSDASMLEDGVKKLRAQMPIGHGGPTQCPPVSTYLADLIINKNDEAALAYLTTKTQECTPGMHKDAASAVAWSAATRETFATDQDSRVALTCIRRAIERLATKSGQRILVLASPGFFAQTPRGIRTEADLIDQATR